MTKAIKLPKGFKVTVSKHKPTGMYDCKIWRDGICIQGSSGTLFDYADQARNYGKWLLTKDENIKI